MGITVDLKRGSKQLNNSKTTQERVPLPHANRNLKQQDKLKVKSHADAPNGTLLYEFRKDAAKSSANQHEQSKKGNKEKDGELVKHMSNLPGYLQRVEKGENFQDKVLNVGVLDWTRLEQWKKYQQKYDSKRGSSTALCSSSDLSLRRSTGLSSTSSSMVQAEKPVKHHSSFSSSLMSSHKGDAPRNVKEFVRTAARFQDFDTASRSTLSRKKNLSQTFKPFERGQSDIVLEKGKIKDIDQKVSSEPGHASGKFKTSGVSLRPKENISSGDGKPKKTVEVLPETDVMRTNIEQKIISEMGAGSSRQGSCDVSPRSKEKRSAGRVATKSRAGNLQEIQIDLGNQRQPGKDTCIVLLLPKELPRKQFPEVCQTPEPRTNMNAFSGAVSTKKIKSAELCSEIPHSCPLPSVADTKSTSDLTRSRLSGDQSMELSSSASHMFRFSEKTREPRSEGKYAVKKKLDTKPVSSSYNDSLEVSNQEAVGPTPNKSRNPSPNRRFSFSLGRMGRSLSFKEGSTAPQLNSTYVSVKSGPVNSDASSDSVVNLNKEKSKGHNRARSSPLRRLLDPILKHKEANQRHHSETSSQLSFSSFSSGPLYSYPNEKVEESWVQALLHLKINNGLPLFKFVVGNSSDVLAATMKNLTSPGKDNSGPIYTFYLVNEIKKKSGGWISQGSKVRSCGYAYNVVGQMKVSISDLSDASRQDSDQYLTRESVLFGVDLNRELAASVVKLTKNLSHFKDEDKMEKDHEKCFPENQCSNNISVILPGGVHSTPNKGEPSPLIERWKSGGLCDCGGWDVGCKLRVLSDGSKSSKTFKTGSSSDQFELFQEEAQQNKPIFSLMPLKDGMYSIDFNESISRLQAFFICVAAISSQKSLDQSEASNISEAKSFEEPDWSDNFGQQAKYLPAKYTPNPPLSPVGRV